jgi:hypothetical protein
VLVRCGGGAPWLVPWYLFLFYTFQSYPDNRTIHSVIKTKSTPLELVNENLPCRTCVRTETTHASTTSEKYSNSVRATVYTYHGTFIINDVLSVLIAYHSIRYIPQSLSLRSMMVLRTGITQNADKIFWLMCLN